MSSDENADRFFPEGLAPIPGGVEDIRQNEENLELGQTGEDDSLHDFVVFVKEIEAVLVIGENAVGLTELAARVTERLRILGHNISEDVEVKVPVSSSDGLERKFMFCNLPKSVNVDTATAELAKMVTFLRTSEGRILKSEEDGHSGEDANHIAGRKLFPDFLVSIEMGLIEEMSSRD